MDRGQSSVDIRGKRIKKIRPKNKEENVDGQRKKMKEKEKEGNEERRKGLPPTQARAGG